MFTRYIRVVMTLVATLALIVISETSSTIYHKLNLPENTEVGSKVAEISDLIGKNIKHETKGNFHLMSQELSHAGVKSIKQNDSWLSLNEDSGIVVLRRKLNREKLCHSSLQCVIHLMIYVSSLFRIVNLDILIIDVNEHPPTFPVKFILLNISENAEINDEISLDRYIAHDLDAGNNSLIEYTLSSNSHFSLISYHDGMGSRLKIKLQRPLDYEKKSFYQLRLIAIDNGEPPLSSYISLHVRVLDENDNDPVFEKKEYSILLQENINPGQEIAKVQARDPDTGLAGTIRYFLSSQNKPALFTLVNVVEFTGEVILISPLDRESFASLNVLIEARDLGKEQRVGKVRLIIHIVDVNDNSPEINIRFFSLHHDNTVYISESSIKGFVFAYISADDKDLGANGEVSLNLYITATEQNNDRIQTTDIVSDNFLLSNLGLLEVDTLLDVDKHNYYTIVVTACDRGVRRRCSESEINVVILDENNHSPRFKHKIYNLSLAENTSAGKFLMKLEASDGDARVSSALQKDLRGEIVASTNGDVTYSLSGGDGIFSIEPRTGIITLVQPLDREKKPIWKLKVTASDGGVPKSLKSSCDILITITDVNDNAPVFVNPVHEGAILYSTILRDTIISKIQAVDYDLGRNAAINYNILSVDGLWIAGQVNNSLFVLDSFTGYLKLNMSNPRLLKSLGSHKVIIQASDLGMPPKKSERSINVIITDDLHLPTTSSSQENEADTNTTLLIITTVLGLLLVLLLIICVVVLATKCKRYNKQRIQTRACQNNSTTLQDAMNIVATNSIGGNHVHSKDSSATFCSSSFNTQQNQKKEKYELQIFQSSSHDGSLTSKVLLKSDRPSTLPIQSIMPQLDGDSGRGESESEYRSRDMGLEEKDFRFTRRRPSLSELCPSSGELDELNNLGSKCSKQCLRYGHSDTCWMPCEGGQSHLLSPHLSLLSEEKPQIQPYDLESIPKISIYLENVSPAHFSEYNSTYSSDFPVIYAESLKPEKHLKETSNASKVYSPSKHTSSESYYTAVSPMTAYYATKPELV